MGQVDSRSEGTKVVPGGDAITGSERGDPQSCTARSYWRNLDIHTCIKIFVVGGLFYYVFHREISDIVRQWVDDPNWSHGFLIPVFSLYFLSQRRGEILSGQYKANYLGLVFLILGLVFYPLNIVHFQYGYLRPVGMIATLGAVVLFLGGWRLLKYVWLPIVFLVFAVPLPDRYYVRLTMPMRLLSAKVAGALLGLVRGIETSVSGAVVEVFYRGQRLEPPLDVAEACSGMRLLMAFVALGVAMAYLHYRPLWQRLVLLASTIPIAILCNVIRVAVTGFIYVFIHPKYAAGIYHDLLGLAMLPLAFGFYGFLAWFMSSLFVEETEAAEEVVVRRQRQGRR